ncbi:MAG: D-aminoacylase, partial [Vicinamibacteria bacterium]
MYSRRYLAVLLVLMVSCSPSPSLEYDVILRNGTIYDGSGSPPYLGDLAIEGDRILAVGEVSEAKGETELDLQGLAIAPGFINMLS